MNFNKNNGYKKNTIDFFNRVAEKKHGDSYKHYKTVLSWIDYKTEKRILDLGCGKGELLKEVDKMLGSHEGDIQYKIVGLDISMNMIEKAKKNNKNIEFIVGDSQNLPFKDNDFKVIICLNSFHHYENPEKVVKEMYRVLEKGGNIILGEINLFKLLKKLVNKILPYTTNGDVKIYSSDEIKQMFIHEGFIFVKDKFIFPSLKVYLLKKPL
ncbi:class I SAM-dependent methyltransferase [uncultured Cetobacterium sp.]|uniref:class I SAM-dependent methyltransferase n=1 Tax=uncultured Cetobacterium sp. TaxID=527638 RepID=UPI002615F584|nr:class I SAM-dependent methyltransferase [uncultured Cetobacterium sp.]